MALKLRPDASVPLPEMVNPLTDLGNIMPVGPEIKPGGKVVPRLFYFLCKFGGSITEFFLE